MIIFIFFILLSFSESQQRIHHREELHIFESFCSIRSYESKFVFDGIDTCQQETTLQSQEWPVYQIMSTCFERLKDHLMTISFQATDSGNGHCSYNSSYVSVQSLSLLKEQESLSKFQHLNKNPQTQMAFNTFLVVFSVEGTNCLVIDGSNIQGGASFLVDANINEEYLISCFVKDHFDNKYTIHCYVPQPLTSSSDKLCLQVSIGLRFEHFDAYADDSKNRQVHVLNSNILERERFCMDISNQQQNNIENSASYYHMAKTNGVYIRPFSRTTFRNPQPYDGYEWYDQKYGFNHYKISAIQNCLQKINLTIVGESHARYYWDALVGLYLRDTDTIKNIYVHHGDVDKIVPSLHSTTTTTATTLAFHWRLFVNNMTNFIEKDIYSRCTSGYHQEQRQVFILQSGSWDVNFFSLRYTIQDERALQAMVKAIRKIVDSPSCQESGVSIVLLGTPPARGEIAVTRNFFSIAAMNEYLEKAFGDYLHSNEHKSFQWVSVEDKLMPFALANQEVCGDHYLCHEKDSTGIKYSTGGAAMFRETLFTVCGNYGNIKKKKNANGDDVVDDDDDDGIISNHPDNFYESSKLIAVVDQDTKEMIYYVIENGFRRRIPDFQTLQFMEYHEKDIKKISIDEAEEMLLGVPFISLRDGMLYNDPSDRTVYMMEGGKRRPFNSGNTFLRLGKDFGDVISMSTKDISIIPIGDWIT